MNSEENSKEYSELCTKILEKVDLIKNAWFSPEECMLHEETVNSREQYEEARERYMKKYEKYQSTLNEIALEGINGLFFYDAYCAACGKDVRMPYHGLKEVASHRQGNFWMWREDFFCPNCGGQGRIRYITSKLKREYKRGMKVYMYEYNAPGYWSASQFVSAKDLTGSEFFGSEYQSGEYVNGILHEDAAKLSFEDASMDIMISLDVFEHIYFYEKAFEEVYRVLKPGGKLLCTIPMYLDHDYTEDRAKIVDGKTIFLKEPIYYGGDSAAENGLLEYTEYGWDIIPIIKSVGFSEVNMNTYYSINDAYLGSLNFYFEIVK